MVIKEDIQVMKSLSKNTAFVESVSGVQMRMYSELDWATQLETLQWQLQLWR